MLSRPSSLAGLIRQSAALRSTSRHPAVIGPVLGIPGSSCLSSTPSGLSLLNYPELPPSTSAGSLLRALPSSFRTSTGHRVGGGNPWHSKTQQPTSRWGGFRRLVRSLSLRPFWQTFSTAPVSGATPASGRGASVANWRGNRDSALLFRTLCGVLSRLPDSARSDICGQPQQEQ